MKKATQSAVAKPARPAKVPARARLQTEVTALQQQVRQLAAGGKHKAAASSKHQTSKASAKHSTTRGWSPDRSVALCSARAVAESLRIALGVHAADDDVAGLYFRTQSDPDAGESILATLEAARRYGIGGCGPEGWRQVLGQRREACGAHHGSCPCAAGDCVAARCDAPFPVVHGLILGLQLPQGPHAVLADDGAWWSWGEPCSPASFPGAVIEECWAVTW